MATLEAHLQQASHHQECLRFLQSRTEFADWSAIVAFYAAVEFVEAVFAVDGLHSKDHGDRKQMLRHKFREGRRRSFFEAYNELYQFSLDARYFHAKPDDATLARLLQRLATVESFAKSLIPKQPE